MKKHSINIFIFICLCHISLSAQDFRNQRYDRQRIITADYGNACWNNDPWDTIHFRRGVIMDFNGDTLQMWAIDTFEHNSIPPKIGTYNASTQICDRTGTMLAHFNGQYLTDRYYNTIEVSVFHDDFTGYMLTLNIGCTIILPMPDSEDQFILIGVNDFQFEPRYGLYAAEDISTVVFKGNSDGTLDIIHTEPSIYKAKYIDKGAIRACRHANGRDWWILSPERLSNKVYYFLLDPEGLRFSHEQELSDIMLESNYTTHFSPQGNYYTRTEIDHISMHEKINHGQIFPFDRCAGRLSDPIEFTLPYEDTARIADIFFEPNERYVYIASYTTLWQGDMYADDFASSLVRVGRYDPRIIDNFRYLAINFPIYSPDGKIYLLDGNNMFRMSVIHHPSEQGEACGFEYAALTKPSCAGFLDNQPHFNLGPLDGSPCDTLGLDNPLSTETPSDQSDATFASWPNPTTGTIHLHASIPFRGSVVVKDVLGRTITRVPYTDSRTIDIDTPPGMVYIQWVDTAGRVVHSGRQMVVR